MFLRRHCFSCSSNSSHFFLVSVFFLYLWTLCDCSLLQDKTGSLSKSVKWQASQRRKWKCSDKWVWPQCVSWVMFILSGKPSVPLCSARAQWCISWCDQILLPWFSSQSFSYSLLTDSGSTANASVVSRPLFFSSLPVIASSSLSPLVLTMIKKTGTWSKMLSGFSFHSHCLQRFLFFNKGPVCSVPALSERRWWMHLHSILVQIRTVLVRWTIWSFPLTVLSFTSQSSLRVHECDSFHKKP